MSHTRETREHAINIADEFGTRIIEKYKQGQEEHGGYLWDRNVFQDAIKEAVDLSIYLLTLDEQLDDLLDRLNTLAENMADELGALHPFVIEVDEMLTSPIFPQDSFFPDDEDSCQHDGAYVDDVRDELELDEDLFDDGLREDQEISDLVSLGNGMYRDGDWPWDGDVFNEEETEFDEDGEPYFPIGRSPWGDELDNWPWDDEFGDYRDRDRYNEDEGWDY